MDKVVLDKIKKLLSLASSANEFEAQRANEKVQEVLALHNLSLGDLPTGEAEEVEEVTVLTSSRTVKWLASLLVAVADFYDCQAMVFRRKRGVLTSVVGSPGNVQVTILMFEYFKKAIERVAKEESSIGWVDDTPTFRHGIVLRINSKLNKRKKQILQDGIQSEVVTASALVVKSQSEKAQKDVENWIKNQYPKSNTTTTKFVGGSALRDGFDAGDRIGIDTQLNGNRQRQLSASS